MPAWSVAVTTRVWGPSPSVGVVYDGGEHATAGRASTWQVAVVVVESAIVNGSVGVLSLMGPVTGATVTTGLVLSTMRFTVAGVGSV